MKIIVASQKFRLIISRLLSNKVILTIKGPTGNLAIDRGIRTKVMNLLVFPIRTRIVQWVADHVKKEA